MVELSLQNINSTAPYQVEHGAVDGSFKFTSESGATIQSDGGFVTISGLDNGEQVRFFSVDGKMLGEVKAADGTACFAATRGSVVIAKIGSDSVKIAVE